ncbi:tRNA uridine-5-carboxymethylaminomethyl(34) synthesis enzyme MnmG [Alteriqipengyuania lutimaris]|uniref:tRNA uridine 5-carboxymethylaminomethyl modification enzyme MnmG n=1 Tax=Alteriqipengyuania lutimaris TaxID=1538146 RepID=A0A395LIX2_9SPHN|nr:tRNA uridine-5-carboxymethylaminomethyl(34) synthesis enzyme MnmG [Alteriqipengyuania lutimaris]MBB3034433.1 tRNA uridine 5-carboxymethylaminomethyl modification enzyme [Alteriqipengyuania lutimaris]RDS76671.1 tRNA uridine-5-carboxymethylaminomethyl(34) synthesis enzyme MnmG [Alteriqipengyuania lutimaris]
MRHYPIIIIGGGHAGVEAACVAARMGVRVALVTMDAAKIGAMSCNPAIGGLGKGHLVREVDAFDGVLGRAADAGAIHYRMLNRSKGSAVWGPRVQADRTLFGAAVRAQVAAEPTLDVLEGEVTGLRIEGDRMRGLTLGDGAEIGCEAAVLCTGTFLGGILFRGEERHVGGRLGEGSAATLAAQLREVALPLARLKTGTPPRLDGRTIDWARLDVQPSDADGWTMSPLSRGRSNPQVFCAVTRTNAQSHDIIRANLSRSPLFSGAIGAKGPRYCPSIEDKIHRFGDRDGHQIFLEPEGLDTPLVYPNGISTSLPVDVQEGFLRAIEGLEQVRVAEPGYAVEYDHVDPRSLDRGLQMRNLRGLYCAGQINGTTGYEEAAAQGLMAGLHAACAVAGRDLPALDRANSYMAVMVDDLTLHGVSEPYRMLTARAEYRLRLRANNASTRLTPLAIASGCVSGERRAWFEAREAERESVEGALATERSPSEMRALGFSASDDAGRQPLRDWARFPGYDLGRFAQEGLVPRETDAELREEIAEDLHYAPYVARQDAELRELRANERIGLAPNFPFPQVPGLSNEMVERLTASRPNSLAQAARVPGVTPAAIAALLVFARKHATAA